MWECVCERKGELKDLSAEVLTTTGKIILWLHLKPKMFASLWAETTDNSARNTTDEWKGEFMEEEKSKCKLQF